jgi:formylglycine-generating enzyme required for sulfatase activity
MSNDVGSASIAPPGKSGEPEPWSTRVNSRDGLTYVWIYPGTFQMGCSPSDKECSDDEKPVHWVTLTNGFWLGQTPVPQAAYQRVTGVNPSQSKGQQLPVDWVTWGDAISYCSAVGMRLPTEAEWEYAARAGSTASRYGDINAIAWYDANSNAQTHPVAQKQPNAWKLYDMLGNVWQWTADWYSGNYYRQSPQASYSGSRQQDPLGPSSGENATVRGGSSESLPAQVRVSSRYAYLDPNYGQPAVGFRCAAQTLP